VKMSETEIHYYENELNVPEAAERFELLDCDEGINICDLSSVERMFRLWQKNLPRIKPFYAVKCNNDPQIVQTLATLGTGFDCASKAELKQIFDLGVTPDRIIYANPCRTVRDMKYAQENDVIRLTVDNEFEIYKIHKYYPKANLVVRFRCDAKKAEYPLGAKFGCDPKVEAPALMLLANALCLSVIGTSFHVGSGCMDNNAHGQGIEKASFLFKFSKVLGFDMHLLDIGGGFQGCNDEDFEKTSEVINSQLNLHFADDAVQIISEPGQFFVAAACTIVCKIHAKREIRDAAGRLKTIMYYLNDGVFGSLSLVVYGQTVAIRHYLDANKALTTFNSTIWGPTCDATDKICDSVQLPNLNAGDLIGFPELGAYSIVLGTSFNGFTRSRTVYYKAK
ncbi:hypothetical protein KR222_005887, partial [Zaprionus bogoriensis]